MIIRDVALELADDFVFDLAVLELCSLCDTAALVISLFAVDELIDLLAVPVVLHVSNVGLAVHASYVGTVEHFKFIGLPV